MERWREWLEVLIRDHRKMPGLKVLKTSETVEVLEAQLPCENEDEKPLRVVCKQSKVRGVKDRMAAAFRGSAARRNFDRASMLQSRGICTATPLAYVERHSPCTSWLVTEFLDGLIDLDAYVLTVLSRGGAERSRRISIIRCVAGLFGRLKWAGLYHSDMKASNILLANTGDPTVPPQAYLVDLDGLAPLRPWRSAWKPVVRLAASLMQYPSVRGTDYARFLREYMVAAGQDGRAWRSHFQRLRKQAARYARAASSRKHNKLDGYSG